MIQDAFPRCLWALWLALLTLMGCRAAHSPVESPPCLISTARRSFDLGALGALRHTSREPESRGWYYSFSACGVVSPQSVSLLCSSEVRSAAIQKTVRACHSIGAFAKRTTSATENGVAVSFSGGDGGRSTSIVVECADVPRSQVIRVGFGAVPGAHVAFVRSRAGCPLECLRNTETGAVCSGAGHGTCTGDNSTDSPVRCVCLQGYAGHACEERKAALQDETRAADKGTVGLLGSVLLFSSAVIWAFIRRLIHFPATANQVDGKLPGLGVLQRPALGFVAVLSVALAVTCLYISFAPKKPDFSKQSGTDSHAPIAQPLPTSASIGPCAGGFASYVPGWRNQDFPHVVDMTAVREQVRNIAPLKIEAAAAIFAGATLEGLKAAASRPVFFVLDVEENSNLSHWMMELAVFLREWPDILSTYPNARIVVGKKRGYKQRVFALFSITDEQVILLADLPSVNYCIFPPFQTLPHLLDADNDVTLFSDRWFAFIRYMWCASGLDVREIYTSTSKPTPLDGVLGSLIPFPVLVIPRGNKENYIHTERSYPGFEPILEWAQNNNGQILDPDAGAEFRIQVRMIASARIIVVTEGTAFYIDGALASGSHIICVGTKLRDIQLDSPTLRLSAGRSACSGPARRRACCPARPGAWPGSSRGAPA